MSLFIPYLNKLKTFQKERLPKDIFKAINYSIVMTIQDILSILF